MSVSSRPASPGCSSTGSRSPSPGACGCSTERIGATTTDSGPVVGSSSEGCASRRSTASRWPTVSARGERRSCGRVSQPGYTATVSGGSRHRSAAARSSASAPVLVTASTVRSRATDATANGRSAAGPLRSSEGAPIDSTAVASAGSSSAASSSPERVMSSEAFQLNGTTTGPVHQRGRGTTPGYGGRGGGVSGRGRAACFTGPGTPGNPLARGGGRIRPVV